MNRHPYLTHTNNEYEIAKRLEYSSKVEQLPSIQETLGLTCRITKKEWQILWIERGLDQSTGLICKNRSELLPVKGGGSC